MRARPLPLARYCIGLLALLVLATGPLLIGASAQPAEGVDPANILNRARVNEGLEQVARHEGLDQLSARYLDEIMASRTLVPPGYGQLDGRVLTEDIVAAIGPDGFSYRYVGVVVAYGQDIIHAMQVANGTVANRPALFEPAMTLTGITSAVVPAGEPWFAPPPGGVGREIEMTGMTVVVIVTAGQFRAGL